MRRPELAAELHPTRNGALTADDLSPGSSRRVWWRCANGHVWQATVKTRAQAGSRCPRCAPRGHRGVTLAEAHPELLGQWHSALNGGPGDHVAAGSHKRCWWRCPIDPTHIWRAQVKNRVRAGTGCPYCAGKRATPATCLATIAPDLADQWHPDRNGPLSPSDVLPHSSQQVWWRCPAGHEWIARIANRTRGSSCPGCPARRSPNGRRPPTSR